ncbi:hypothetical protein HKX48_003693 [Thoreauomyces humboldtii]|nr:hypothetical protein HKX48_003693 [Thoreauomyces humboldtii]
MKMDGAGLREGLSGALRGPAILDVREASVRKPRYEQHPSVEDPSAATSRSQPKLLEYRVLRGPYPFIIPSSSSTFLPISRAVVLLHPVLIPPLSNSLPNTPSVVPTTVSAVRTVSSPSFSALQRQHLQQLVNPGQPIINSHILYYLCTEFPQILSQRDLLACSQVNRQWYRVATPVIWRNLSVDLTTVDPLFSALKASRRAVEEGGEGEGENLLKLVRTLSINVSYSGPGWANEANEDIFWDAFMKGLVALNGLLTMFGGRLMALDKISLNFQVRTGLVSTEKYDQFQAHLDTLFTSHLADVPRVHLAYDVPAADLLGKRVQGLQSRLRSLAIDGDWYGEPELVNLFDTLLQPVPTLQLIKCNVSDNVCTALVRNQGTELQVLTIKGSKKNRNSMDRLTDLLAGCANLKTCTWVDV